MSVMWPCPDARERAAWACVSSGQRVARAGVNIFVGAGSDARRAR